MAKQHEEETIIRSQDIPWEELRLYLPEDETEEENKALYKKMKKQIEDGFPIDEFTNEELSRLTPLQQKEIGIPAFYVRPVTPRLVSNDQKESRLSDMAQLEDELYAAEKAAGIQRKQPLLVRLLVKWADYKENRVRHSVKKSTYIWLTVLLGWCGMHRFYEKRWKLGLFYLLTSWTGFGIALAVVDFMIAVPIKADEDGMILI